MSLCGGRASYATLMRHEYYYNYYYDYYLL